MNISSSSAAAGCAAWLGYSACRANGRTESILLSMPPLVQWRYDWHSGKGTPGAELYEKYLHPKDWV